MRCATIVIGWWIVFKAAASCFLASLPGGSFHFRTGLQAHVLSTREDCVYIAPTTAGRRASPALRDLFLNAIDRSDAAAVQEIGLALLGCANSLPMATCAELGLTPGSTYGDAAEVVTRPPSAVHPGVA
jgi:hypothetical protein